MSNRKTYIPQARSEDVIVTELDDEILIYDKARDKAHCLNSTAARVWKLANGKRTVAEIAARMEKELHSPMDERVVWYALDKLEKDHLLREDIVLPAAQSGLTRREFVGAMGKAAFVIAVPKVVSLNAPNSALVSSCLPNGSGCISGTQCCSGCCGAPVGPARGPASIGQCLPGPCT
jgi:hypothetical protein